MLTESLAAELLRLAVQYERALNAHASAILVRSAHEASLLPLVASGRPVVHIVPVLGGFPPSVFPPSVFPPSVRSPRPSALRTSAPAHFLVVADVIGEAQEGLLWLVRDVWPLLRAAAAPAEPRLRLVGSGWRPLIRRGPSADNAARVPDGWLGSTSRNLADVLSLMKWHGELELGREIGSLADARGVLDAATALLLPRLGNESGGVAPSWGQAVPELAALWRGVPLVTTNVAAPTLPPGVAAESCGIAVHDDAAGFAAAAATLLAPSTWRARFDLAGNCATTQLTAAQSDLGWTEILSQQLQR